jgi:hypothetical protein
LLETIGILKLLPAAETILWFVPVAVSCLWLLLAVESNDLLEKDSCITAIAFTNDASRGVVADRIAFVAVGSNLSSNAGGLTKYVSIRPLPLMEISPRDRSGIVGS